MESGELLSLVREGFRHCAGYYAWQGRRIEPVVTALAVTNSFEEAHRELLNDFLGSDAEGRDFRVCGLRWAALRREQQQWELFHPMGPGFVAALRSRDERVALEAATRVLLALLDDDFPKFDDWRRDFSSVFAATVLLRCTAPSRFPVVGIPLDLMRRARDEDDWQDKDTIVADYLVQVRDLGALSVRWGLDGSARLEEGLFQLVRCLCDGGSCPSGGACQSNRRMTELGIASDYKRARVRDVLPSVNALLWDEVERAAEGDGTRHLQDEVLACIRTLLPSAAAMEEALRRVQALSKGSGESDEPRVHRFVPAVEAVLRARLVDVARGLAAEGGEGVPSDSATARALGSNRSTVRSVTRRSERQWARWATERGKSRR